MTQNLYYHVFGTAREKSLDGTQDNPIFWRTVTPISWDKNPLLITAGGIDQFDQTWKIKTKYGQQVDIYPISESQYQKESVLVFCEFYNGEFIFPNGVNLKRTCLSYSPLSSPPESTKLAYDVEIVKVAPIVNPVHSVNPYPLNIPNFPIVPDKDYQTEIQFSNFEYDNTGTAEQRIIEWADPIRTFNLSRTALQSNDLNNLLDFHESIKGSKGDFFYQDLSDFEATKNPKILENGVSTQGILYPDADGVKTEFILTKKYSCGNNIYYRPILCPDPPHNTRTFVDTVRPTSESIGSDDITVDRWRAAFFSVPADNYQNPSPNYGHWLGSITLRLTQVVPSSELVVSLYKGSWNVISRVIFSNYSWEKITDFIIPSNIPSGTSNVVFSTPNPIFLGAFNHYAILIGIKSGNGQYNWIKNAVDSWLYPTTVYLGLDYRNNSYFEVWWVHPWGGQPYLPVPDSSSYQYENQRYKFALHEYPSNPKIYQGNTLLSGYSVTPDRVVFDIPPTPGTLTWEGTFKTLCHFEEDKLDYQPIVKTVNTNLTTVSNLFSVPKLILRESRIEPGIILPDIFNNTIDHNFALNLTKQSTISPQFETNIITLSSGEKKRYSRRNSPADVNSLQQRKTLEQKDIEYLICLWLCAKGSGATFRYPDLVNNLSIVSRFNSQSLSYQNQTSLRIYSLGELQIRRFSEGIVIDSGIDSNLSSPVLTLCRCILIELTDGQKLGYTNFSRDLTIDGVVFKSRHALDPTALERKLGIESDNEEMQGAFSDNITENLIFSDRFQEAKIITAVVDWRNLPSSLLSLPDEQVQVGFVGEITSKSGETYTLENLTESSVKLRQSRNEKTSPSCRWFFGQDNGDGTGCRKIPPTYTTYVASVADRRSFDVYGDNFVNLKWGKCTFVDGKNESATYAIYQTIQQSGQRTRIELFTGAADSIAAHDKVILTAGCERTYNACKDDWDNVQNFGGIPSFGNFMKGNDFYLAPPKQS